MDCPIKSNINQRKYYEAAVYFSNSLLNSLKSFAESLVYLLIFTMKKCTLFSLTSFGTWKYDCDKNQRNI